MGKMIFILFNDKSGVLLAEGIFLASSHLRRDISDYEVRLSVSVGASGHEKFRAMASPCQLSPSHCSDPGYWQSTATYKTSYRCLFSLRAGSHVCISTYSPFSGQSHLCR